MSELKAVNRHAEILVVDSARNVGRTDRLLVVAYTLILLLFLLVAVCLVAVALLFCRLNALQLHVEQCQLLPQQQQHRRDEHKTAVHHHNEHEEWDFVGDNDDEQQMTVQRPRRQVADSSNNKNSKNKNKQPTEQQRPAAEMVPVVHFQTTEIHFHRVQDEGNVHRVLGGWKLLPVPTNDKRHHNHTITKNSFYMIYAQMEYHTTDSLNGFAVVVRGKRNDIKNITRCLTGVDTTDSDNTKLKTCYTATVAQLDKGQTLELHDLSLNDFEQPKDFMYPTNCYWGIVQLVPRRK